MSQSDVSIGRRSALARAAALFGAGYLAVGLSNGQNSSSDATLLNYALALENLESAFYTQGLLQFSSTDFANSSFIQNFGSVISGDVYAYLSLIRDQEQQHVRALNSLIAGLGGTPVKTCTYNFGYKTPDDFMTLAALLENTAVSAYTGALYQIQNLSIRTDAAAIATVEGRHSAYLNLLTGTSPSPASFDNAATSATILAAVAQYTTTC